jgi:hypothetical protein
MDGFYFSVNLDNERTLCLSPLTERRLSMATEQIQDSSGHFLYEKCGSGEDARIEVLAQVVSDEAIFMLRKFFNMD